MKIKVISRSESDYLKERKGDVDKVHHNLNPVHHPFERAREYKRALNAVKLDKIFAKPFVGALDGHSDGVWCTATSPKSLVCFLSGACDGEVRIWDLPTQKTVWSVYAHKKFVRGITVDKTGTSFISCSDDGTIKQYLLNMDAGGGIEAPEYQPDPLNVWTGKEAFYGIDHSWEDDVFATCSSVIQLWSVHKSQPMHTFTFGHEHFRSIQFNPGESSVLAACSNDRSISLFDVRTSSTLRKVTLRMCSNAISWNPREPMNFTVANEDYNLYTFDMRNLEKPLVTHMGHVGAVMSVAYSSTGREFVSGSYDRTVRLWNRGNIHSRDVYHGKRMQRVYTANYSADSKFIISGSDDTNLRIWKARASEMLEKPLPRQQQKLDYYNKLKQRYAAQPEIRRIANHHHVPKVIMKMGHKQRHEKHKEQPTFDVQE
ncbi:hypothetical protein WA158_003886 [Blastocystis sp. Blastoise]